MADEYPDISYEKIAGETANAYLFDLDGDGKREVWIPKSQIELHREDKEFNIPHWLAVEKELV